MSKIDGYLLQSLRADRTEPQWPTAAMFPTDKFLKKAIESPMIDLGPEVLNEGIEPMLHIDVPVPILIRVEDTAWDGSEIGDLQVNSRIGTVISAFASPDAIRALANEKGVQTIEQSRPTSDPGELANSVPLVGGMKVQTQHSESGDKAIVAIIDDGIDVLHEAFRDQNGKSRIRAFWDQHDTSGTPNAHPSYGTLHTQADIDGYIAAGTVPPNLTRNKDGHGTHVASIAAGRAVGTFAGGMAPESTLLVVRAQQMRFEDGKPASLGYSHNHVDALKWIRDEASKAELPVAVNMSLGMNAGAHDGSSALEIAIDEFSAGGRAPGRVIVKSAGNEGGRDAHARVVLAPNSVEILSWNSKNIRRDQDLVELWFPSAHDIEFQLENPLGNLSNPVNLTSTLEAGTFATSGTALDSYDLSLDRLNSDNGDTRLLVRIHRGNVTGKFEPGIWSLHIKANSVLGACRVDAWIERSDSRAIAFTSHVANDCSLSIPATARTVISAGSISPVAPFAIAASSSRGPTRDDRAKPDVTAPGDGIVAARGETLRGTIAKSGTSMAAPHVTGALAQLMSFLAKKNVGVPNWQSLNAVQMRSAVINSSLGFNGIHDPALGFGRLDAAALIDYFI